MSRQHSDCSQEEELVAEWFLLIDVLLDIWGVRLRELLQALALLRVPDASEQICDLVGIHAGSWNLDWT